MTTPWPDPPGTPEPRTEPEMSTGVAMYTGQPHTGWARDKSCGCGAGEDERCDCFDLLAEYAAFMKSLMEPVYVRQVGGRWEVAR